MTATIVDQARLILGGDESALVELRAKHPRLKTVKQRWFAAGELDALERSAATLAESYDCWVGCAARARRGGRGADVAFAANLWTDCDEPAAVEALRAFRPAPTLVVRSSTLEGERLQAWWALDRRLAPDEIKPALGRLTAALAADASGVDTARVLRAIGTLNHKRAEPEPVVATYFTGEVHALDDVLRRAPVVASASTGAGCGEHHAPVDRVPHRQRYPYLKDFVVRLARAGITDERRILAYLRLEFELSCEPLPAPEPGSLEALAAWAANCDIAQRERRRPR